MADYPPSLPQFQLLPVSYTQQDARVVTTFDAGPTKVRRRFTDTSTYLTTRVGPFTRGQMKFFWFWWSTTLGEGVGSWEWQDPKEPAGTPVTLYFDARQPPPTFEAIGVEGQVQYFTNYSLEIRP